MADDAAALLFRQIRGLFRYAPINESAFVQLAPNVAHTLNRSRPFDALADFWEVFDELTDDKYLQALRVLLGFSDHQGNVLSRKSSFATDKDPRTVARWADRGIERVVQYIMSKSKVAVAQLLTDISRDGDVLKVKCLASTAIDMEPLELIHRTTDTESTRTIEVPSTDEHIKFDFELAAFRHQVELKWDGPTYPMVFLMAEPSLPGLVTRVLPGYILIGRV